MTATSESGKGRSRGVTSPAAGPTDAALVELALRGERRGWELLVERYQRLIFSIPRRYGLSEMDAADVFQSVCVILLEKLGDLRDQEKLSSWLITTTSRLTWEHLRRGRSAVEEPVEEAAAGHPADGPLPDEALVHLEEQDMVRRAVDHLAPRCRELLRLLFFDSAEPSYREIADRLGIPEGSIGPTRIRCLQRLARILERWGLT